MTSPTSGEHAPAGAAAAATALPSAGERTVDIAIVGGGAAGLAAGLYAARARRRVVLLEGGVLGGQMATTGLVENYPGFPEGVQGPDLAMAMHAQATRFGLETAYERVLRIAPAGGGYAIETGAGGSGEAQWQARAVIVAPGARYRKLEVLGEAEFTGRGVSYCATCDAALYRDETVAVIGGGDAALDEALFTARFASHVYLVHRRDTFRATEILQERVRAEPRIEVIWNATVQQITGTHAVSAITLRDVSSGALRELPVTGVFVFVGQAPNTEFLADIVALDAQGYAHADAWMESGLPGLFIAGDVRSPSARQIVVAAGDGATAAIRADQYLSEHGG